MKRLRSPFLDTRSTSFTVFSGSVILMRRYMAYIPPFVHFAMIHTLGVHRDFLGLRPGLTLLRLPWPAFLPLMGTVSRRVRLIRVLQWCVYVCISLPMAYRFTW